MIQIDPISLTRELISLNTINPPGNEAEAAQLLGKLLSDHGFEISYHEFGTDRLHLVAEKGVSRDSTPLVLSGHLDTVPLGDKEWTADPFDGDCTKDKIFGRGSSDMKAGVAAMTVAAIEATAESIEATAESSATASGGTSAESPAAASNTASAAASNTPSGGTSAESPAESSNTASNTAFSAASTPEGGLRLIFTAGEELGCQGIQQLLSSNPDLGKASAIIVGEPTSNIPAIGHKGALYLHAVSKGKTAHSSMPELGDNAIYKAARAIGKIEAFQFGATEDPLLGFPTINVGKMEGGLNLNSVPDHAYFTMDIRSTTMVSHPSILEKLKKELGSEIVLETLTNLSPVSTPVSDPFVRRVCETCGVDPKSKDWKKALPYMTDGSALQAFYGGVPTIILGPGEPALAHQTDEYCFIENIYESVSIYKEIILNRRK